MSDASTQPPAQPPLSFEQAVQRLEKVVHELEEGNLGLDESLARFEEGIALLRRCHELLQMAERRIEMLTGVDAQGNPITTPLDDAALSLAEKAELRSRRRSAPGTPPAAD